MELLDLAREVRDTAPCSCAGGGYLLWRQTAVADYETRAGWRPAVALEAAKGLCGATELHVDTRWDVCNSAEAPNLTRAESKLINASVQIMRDRKSVV